MATLILSSLEIRNFRAFHDLKIERLGRVNLIVGKNNVGKTSLLEALQLYARRVSTPIVLGFDSHAMCIIYNNDTFDTSLLV